MNELAVREAPWSPTPGGRVRLRLALDRPRVLDGLTGVVRYFWPYADDGNSWLVTLDEPAMDGGRVYTLVRCAGGELEPAPEPLPGAIAAEPGGLFGLLWPKRPRPGARDDGSPASNRRFAPELPAGGERGDNVVVDQRPLLAAPEVVTYRQSVEFVGRETELADFLENLSLSVEDDRRRFVYDVAGPSGVGKTWLLRRFRALLQQTGGRTVWIDDADDVVEVMEQTMAQFAAEGHSFPPFDDELRRFRQACREPHSSTTVPTEPAVSPADAPEALPDAAALLSLAGDGLPAARERGTEIVPSRSLSGPRRIVAVEPRALRDAIHALTPRFLDGLRALANGNPLGLFFDVHERTHGFLDDWLRDILDGRYGELAASTVVVVAGTVPLDASRWLGFDPLIAHVRLNPFSAEETRALLAHNWIVEDRVVRAIQQASRGLPVLVATMAVRASDHLDRLTESDRTALDCFLASLGDPVRRSTALDAALPRRLDVDVLTELIEGPPAGPLIDWLRKMPFVERRAGSWVYRQAVRETLLRFGRGESAQRWTQRHGQLAEYYERLRDDLDREPASRLRDATRQSYELEALYHRLCQSPLDHLAAALGGYVDRFGVDQSSARRWAEVVLQAGQDSSDSATQYWGERLVDGIDALARGSHAPVARVFGAVLSTVALDPIRRAKALAWQSRLLVASAQLDPALAVYNTLLELVPESVSSWTERGIILGRLGRYREALASFDRALAIDPAYALAVAGRSRVQRTLRSFGSALDDFERIVRSWPEEASPIEDADATRPALEVPLSR
ncbi:MAG TPA: tetratricopeptide repeat protein [Chloroflexota bacterium]|nr:tetratricopeptide repeat protein [Chloroflexota bacterium]